MRSFTSASFIAARPGSYFGRSSVLFLDNLAFHHSNAAKAEAAAIFIQPRFMLQCSLVPLGRFGGASVPYSRYRINRRVLLSSALHKSLLFKHAAQKEPPCTTQELSQARIETKALNGIELAPVSNEN
jgi:hypothetical protein